MPHPGPLSSASSYPQRAAQPWWTHPTPAARLAALLHKLDTERAGYVLPLNLLPPLPR